jgi:hypothetical protein
VLHRDGIARQEDVAQPRSFNEISFIHRQSLEPSNLSEEGVVKLDCQSVPDNLSWEHSDERTLIAMEGI